MLVNFWALYDFRKRFTCHNLKRAFGVWLYATNDVEQEEISGNECENKEN